MKDIYESYNKYYKREKESILKQLNEIKKQTNDLIISVSKLTKIKSGNVLYRRWKFDRLKCDNANFSSLINGKKNMLPLLI